METSFSNKDEGARGFAKLSTEQKKKIAASGGRATASKTDMSELGRRGGKASGKVRRGDVDTTSKD